MAELRLVELTKEFPDGTRALDGVSLDVADGELLVLVGPSGCGKSTAMRLIAGLDAPTAGQVWLGGRDITRLRPEERDVAMVFQSYALYPHKNVRDNLGFGLRVRGAPRAEVAKRVAEVADMLELTPLLARKPRELSGGQRQRVALGRAIARAPQLFILDEPLSNLDARLRLQTRGELARLQQRLGTTMVYVTHDQEEAMTLGHRVAVMRAGQIEQVGSPMDLYHQPANVFVAGFIGSPPMNLLAGPDSIVGIRPHDLSIAAPADAPYAGRVEWIEALGRDLAVHVRTDAASPVQALVPADSPVHVGDTVGLVPAPGRVHTFDALTGVRTATPAPSQT